MLRTVKLGPAIVFSNEILDQDYSRAVRVPGVIKLESPKMEIPINREGSVLNHLHPISRG